MLCERGRSSHIPTSDYSAAFERVRQAECALAASAGDQYAVPLDLGFKPSSGVTAPLLIQTEHSMILAFSAWREASDVSPYISGTAIVEFDGCYWSTFGYPNDEALEGHPLWGRGLSAYGIFEVHNSHWVRRMTEQNRVAFPNTKDSEARHLIFSFHDNTFECLCRGIKSASISSEPLVQLTSSFAEICEGILEEGS